MQLTATQALDQIRSRAEAIRTDEPQYFPEAASSGDTVRQGDLYITRIDRIPVGSKRIPVDVQLAPGTTRGSRHILSHKRVTMYRMLNGTQLTGPLIRVRKEGVTVTHPEHGDWILPAGCYAITYQRAFATELRAVRD